MGIEAVVFDFGNVIGFFSRLKAARQLAAFAPRGVPAERIADYLFEGELEDAFESGQWSSASVLEELRRRFGLAGTDEQLRLAYADMFTPNDEVCQLVPRLAGRHRLVLLSNTNELHFAHFRQQFAATLDRFDALVVSHEVGLRKPHPGIYEHARMRAGCAASTCLFIDDLPANVEVARACGWQGVVYRPGELGACLAQAGVVL